MDRFWANVQVREYYECWPWVASTTSRGYGQIMMDGKMWLAHRVAYSIENGFILVGKVVMHTCDNPICCNGNHLVCGTQAENLADMRMKGRGSRPPIRYGVSHHNAKLTESEVRIVKSLRGLMSGKKLATSLGVSDTTVYNIWNGRVRVDG